MRIYVIVENMIRERGSLAISAYETLEAAQKAMVRIAESDCKSGIYRYADGALDNQINIFRVSDNMLVYQFWINPIELKK